MREFEKLCNEYRENKRLIEELEAMNDRRKTEMTKFDKVYTVVMIFVCVAMVAVYAYMRIAWG